MANEPDSAQAKLMAKFDFKLDDLDANRHGYVSKRQRFRLRWKSRIRVAIYTVIAMLFAGVECYLLLVVLAAGNASVRLSTLGISCFTLYLFLVGAASTLNAWRVQQDLGKDLISDVEGKIVFALAPGTKSWNTWYGWARERILYSPPINLDLPWRAAYAFEDGKTYRIYFAPYSKVVLSVECISDDRTKLDETG